MSRTYNDSISKRPLQQCSLLFHHSRPRFHAWETTSRPCDDFHRVIQMREERQKRIVMKFISVRSTEREKVPVAVFAMKGRTIATIVARDCAYNRRYFFSLTRHVRLFVVHSPFICVCLTQEVKQRCRPQDVLQESVFESTGPFRRDSTTTCSVAIELSWQ